MDNFLKNIKKKLSLENIGLTKEPKVEEPKNKQEDVRNTLTKLDPNSVVDPDEMHEKLNELSEQTTSNLSKTEPSTRQIIIEAAKSSIRALGPKTPEEQQDKPKSDNEFLEALGREENVFSLCDDFH